MRFWKRAREPFDIEAELRANRSQPPAELVHSITDRIQKHGRNERVYFFSRVSFAASLTAVMLGTLASFGGLSYASSSTKDAFQAVVADDDVLRSPARHQYGHEEGPGLISGGGGGGGGDVAAAAEGAAGEELPFTGLGLITTALVGGALAGLGVALRRASRRPEET